MNPEYPQTADFRSSSIPAIRQKTHTARYSKRRVRATRPAYDNLLIKPTKNIPPRLNYNFPNDYINGWSGNWASGYEGLKGGSLKREIWKTCQERNSNIRPCGRTCDVCYPHLKEACIQKKAREPWKRIPGERSELYWDFLLDLDWEASWEYEDEYREHLSDMKEEELLEGQLPQGNWEALFDTTTGVESSSKLPASLWDDVASVCSEEEWEICAYEAEADDWQII